MLKKYILALSILGLAAPGTTNCGFGLKHAVKNRFLFGLLSGLYLQSSIDGYNHCQNFRTKANKVYGTAINNEKDANKANSIIADQEKTNVATNRKLQYLTIHMGLGFLCIIAAAVTDIYNGHITPKGAIESLPKACFGAFAGVAIKKAYDRAVHTWRCLRIMYYNDRGR